MFKWWLNSTRIAVRIKKNNKVFYISANWKNDINNALIKREDLTSKDLFINKQYARESICELLRTTNKYHKELCSVEFVKV